MIKEVVTAIPLDEIVKAGVENVGATLSRLFEGVEMLEVKQNGREVIVRASDVGEWIYEESPEEALPGARTLYFHDESDGTVGYAISEGVRELTGGDQRLFVSATELLTEDAFAHALAAAIREIPRRYRRHPHEEAEAVAERLRELLGL